MATGSPHHLNIPFPGQVIAKTPASSLQQLGLYVGGKFAAIIELKSIEEAL